MFPFSSGLFGESTKFFCTIARFPVNFDGTNSFMYAETSTELLESGDDTYSYATTALSDDNDSGNVMGFSSASPNMRSQLLFNNS